MRYSIKEVSKRFDISTYTLRYYEREGLLPPIERVENGIRSYCELDLEWITLIKCMRATGMSISHIKDFVNMGYGGTHTIPARKKVILQQKEIIEQHIQEYNEYLTIINHKLTILDTMANAK